MKCIRIIILFIVFIPLVTIKGQIYDGGIILESSLLITETVAKKTDFYLENGIIKSDYFEKTKKEKFFAWGIFYSAKCNLDSSYQIEFRPGVTGGQTFYSTLQFGFYLRKRFLNYYMGLLGVTAEQHFGDNSKYVNHSYTAVLGLGVLLGNKWILHLSVCKPLGEYFGKYYDEELKIHSEVYLNWIAKLNLELDL